MSPIQEGKDRILL